MSRLLAVLSLDSRSVRVFRLLLGLSLIAQSLMLLREVDFFLTDDGLYPRFLLLIPTAREGLISPLNLSGSREWAILWVGSLAVVGVMLWKNLWPRLGSLWAFVVMVALHHRAIPIFFGGDQVLRLACLWSCFLPVARPQDGERRIQGAIPIAVFAQVSLLYLTAGLAKAPREWWTSGIAGQLALQIDAYATAFGRALVHFGGLLAWGTRFVFLLERFGWLLFIWPWRTAWARTLGVLLFAGMHIGFVLLLHLNLFALFCITLLALLLPGEFWDQFRSSRALDLPLAREAPSPLARGWGQVAPAFAVYAILIGITFSFAALEGFALKLPGRAWRWGRITGLAQTWNMFSPFPPREDGWFVFEGETVNGQKVDLLNRREGPADRRKPVDIYLRNPTPRWTEFLFFVRASGREFMGPRLVHYFCRAWNAQHEPPIDKVDVLFVTEYSATDPGDTQPGPARVLVHERCPPSTVRARPENVAATPR